MYEVKVMSDFAASHHLRNYGGKCEQVHGHNWNVEVYFEGESLDDTGLLIDFRVIKEKLREVIQEFDHVDLNAIDYFKEKNPSSEHIAYYIFTKMNEDNSLRNNGRIKKVRVWETRSSCASYYE